MGTLPKVTWKSAVAAGLMLAMTFLSGCASSAAATVNGTKITEKDLNTRLNLYAFLQGPQFDVKAYRSQVLDSLIEETLLYQEAEKRGVKADPATLKQQLDSFHEQLLYQYLPNDVVAQATPDKPPQPTEAQRTAAERQKADAFKKANITQKDFDDAITRQATVQTLLDSLTKDLAVSDADIQAYYEAHKTDRFTAPETVRASHILIQVGEDKDYDKILPKAEEALKAVQQPGADFAALAKKYSDDPGSKDNGGDLGEFAKGDMVPEFEQAAFSLKPGTVSPLVKTQFGYHIIKVAEHKMPEVIPFDQVKGEIHDQVLQQKQSDTVDKLINDLKSKAAITRSKAETKESPAPTAPQTPAPATP